MDVQQFTVNSKNGDKIMVKYTVETKRLWHCPRCGFGNSTETPSEHTEIDVSAICEACGYEDEFDEMGEGELDYVY
jgi:transcription elongation factor Elf1